MRVGLVVPAPNSVAEPYVRASLGSDHEVLVERLPIENGVAGMDAALPAALDRLTHCGIELLFYGCTSSGMSKGYEHERVFQQELAAAAGVPVLTAALSVVEALHQRGVERLAILSPYPHAMEEIERRFFASAGLEVAAIRSLGLGSLELDRPTPAEVLGAARQAWHPAADALFISCLNYRATDEVVRALAEEIEKPVVSSLTASAEALRAAVGLGTAC